MKIDRIIFVMCLISFIGMASATESALEINISGSSPDGYQLQMTIPYETGMSSDFSNIRFYSGNTRYNSGTPIQYWVESYTTSTSANVFVPVPAGASKLYCQWGIEGETASESDIKSVMVFGDDFSEGSVNSTLWTTQATGGTRTFSNGIMTDSISTSVANILIAKTDNNTASVISVAKMRTTTSSGGGCSARLGIKSNATVGSKIALRAAASPAAKNIIPLNEGIAWGSSVSTYTDNSWYILEARHDYSSTFYYRNGQSGAWSSWAINPAGSHLVLHKATTTSSIVAEYDYVYQRLYYADPITASVDLRF